MFLAGDIGGTNCRYALFDGHELSHIQTWSTQESTGLKYDISRYCATVNIPFSRACVAIAGPVDGEEVVLTNAQWKGALSDLPCKGVWANDLVAAAQGLELAKNTQIWGPEVQEGVQVALGVGTGFGQSLRIGDRAFAAEGGHASYAPNNKEEYALWEFIRAKNGRVRVEDVCSGRGMENIVDFLCAKHQCSLDRSIPAGALLGGGEEQPICVEGLDLFLSSLGSVIGDTILRILPEGGVWLCGGVAQKMKRHFSRPSFQEALQNKTPMNRLIQNTPIFVVEEPELGLLGAGCIAKTL